MGVVVKVPAGTVIVASDLTSKVVANVAWAHVVAVAFVDEVQTTVESVQVAPAVSGQSIVWGGLPAMTTVLSVVMFRMRMGGTTARIFTMARLAVLNQISGFTS